MSSPDAHPIVPELVDAAPPAVGPLPAGPGPDGDGSATTGEPDEQVLRPTKLIRIASMVRTMLVWL